ncbi:MAG: hypothetical protein FWE12_02815 [Oscillospiraceae bacterium]|nr:hypothetical protein [Oscillospiraceae bacterium]
MDCVKIEYDFNAYLMWGWDHPVPLSRTDDIIDSNGNQVLLFEGMDVRIYETDYDVFNRKDDLCADGIVIRNPERPADYSEFKWWFQINEFGAKHESDDPDFKLSTLSTSEKRNIIYEHMQRCMSLDKLRDTDKKGQMEFYIRALRQIDNGEL